MFYPSKQVRKKNMVINYFLDFASAFSASISAC